MTDPAFPPIQRRLMRFVQTVLGGEAGTYSVSKLIGDASARQYFRYLKESGESYILAAYPEPFDPLRFSYAQVYRVLTKLDIRVAQIIEMNGPLGIVLQEDLGDETLQKHFLHCSPKEHLPWLRSAIDYIVQLQVDGGALLEPNDAANQLCFDAEKLGWEFQFFYRHFLIRYRGLKIENENRLLREFDQIAEELASHPRVLCHRDFHIRNLMLKQGNLFVTDFQDARWGPPTYDLVSLLKDSISLAPEDHDELVHYFLSRRPELAGKNFQRQFRLMSVQRLLKALGTYGYQVNVRKNYLYEQYMRGSLQRAQNVLAELPELSALQAVVERGLEAFSGPGISE